MNQCRKMLFWMLFVMGLLALLTACSGRQIDSSTATEATEEKTTEETEQTLSAEFGYDADREEETEPEATETTAAQEVTEATTAATTATTEPTKQETTTPESLSYEGYLALTAEQQLAYMESFATEYDFLVWFDAAKAEYDKNNQAIVATGPIDLEDIVGQNP